MEVEDGESRMDLGKGARHWPVRRKNNRRSGLRRSTVEQTFVEHKRPSNLLRNIPFVKN
jgi:hypothetical protein